MSFNIPDNQLVEYSLQRAENAKLDRITHLQVEQSKILQKAAYLIIQDYQGRNYFLKDLKAQYELRGTLTAKQLSCILTHQLKKRTRQTKADIRIGIYTVVLPDGSYKTLRVMKGKVEGQKVVKYLYGPVNTSDYVAFAYIEESGNYHIWKRFQDNQELTKTLKVLAESTIDQQIEFGKAYALSSGNCYRCGRTLTTPQSIQAGIGPKCSSY